MTSNQDLVTGTTTTIVWTQTSVSAANLKAFLLSNTPKKPNEKAKIRFIDCQDVKENTGSQFVGALHMNLNVAHNAQQTFDKMMAGVQGVLEDLVSADVVVIYCQYAAARSPATVDVYKNAFAKHPKRNGNQKAVLLEGGITAYFKLQNPYAITPWLGPAKGKILAQSQRGPKPTGQQVTKPLAQQDDPEDYILYTDP